MGSSTQEGLPLDRSRDNPSELMGAKEDHVGADASTGINLVWEPLEIFFWLIFSVK